MLLLNAKLHLLITNLLYKTYPTWKKKVSSLTCSQSLASLVRSFEETESQRDQREVLQIPQASPDTADGNLVFLPVPVIDLFITSLRQRLSARWFILVGVISFCPCLRPARAKCVSTDTQESDLQAAGRINACHVVVTHCSHGLYCDCTA